MKPGISDLDGLVRNGILRCPDCKERLAFNNDREALSCLVCGSHWPILEGIPCFVRKESLADYGLGRDMDEFIRASQQFGWAAALEARLAGSKQDDYAKEYIGSEARADFRFLMSLPPDAAVVDVGSGWGNISIAFARQCGQVIALDTTVSNLKFVELRAQQEGADNVKSILGDAVHLPLTPKSFDAVLMVGVLEWVAWGRDDGAPRELQTAALREACNTLRSGGQLYIGIENRYSAKSFLGAREPHTRLRFISLLPRALARVYSQLVRRRPFREWTYSEGELRHMLREAGFDSVRFFYPLPGYQNFRYIADLGTKSISHFVLSRLRSHSRFGPGLRLAGEAAVQLGLDRLLSPCFSVIATKTHD